MLISIHDHYVAFHSLYAQITVSSKE